MKRVVMGFFLILFLMNSILAISNSVDSEIKSITHYAEEYEIGNIDYVKLLVYLAESRQNLNELLGATEKEMGGVLKQDEIRKVLGEPNEETKWVWVEGEEHDKKLDDYVPIWKKIIFDGRKIQIRLEAFPSIFTKKQFNEEDNVEEDEGFEENIREGDLIYRLHFGVEFKKPEEQLNIQGKIDEIKNLAEIFSSDPSQANAEALAKESVNAEKTFESYFRQNQGNCEDLMASIFGSENKQPSQNMIVQEISFYEGEKFEVIARLEMCDDCEWNWINLDLWTETRGPMPGIEGDMGMISPDEFKNKDVSYYKSEIISLLDSYKKAADEQNWKETNRIKQKIWMINEAWNQRSNDVWKEVDEIFKSQEQIMSQEQREEFNKNYGWIKQEQEKKKKERELRKTNYEERKQFYLDLFSEYDKKEYSFAQIEFKKRLIELFKEKGEEICNNNQDDNQNEKVDCDDEQCGGKICGKGINTIIEGNETKEVEVDFYCIAGECKAKEEIIEIREEICGNHICGGNETIESCAEDCSICQAFSAVNCSGRVIFSGTDANGCPLEPKCIEEKICSVNEDCEFLCGEGQCVDGKCEVKELTECEEAECVAGDKKIINCQSGEQVVIEDCVNGLWEKTGIECGVEENVTEENCNDYCMSQPHIMCVGHSDISGTYPNCNCGWICGEEELVRDECVSREDCGGENDVCSNGECVTIPEIIPVQPVEPEIIQPEIEQPEQETEVSSEEEPGEEIEQEVEEITQSESSPETPESTSSEESQSEQETIPTGAIIFSFFRNLINKVTTLGKITGTTITGFQTEEETQEAQQFTEDTGQQETNRPESEQKEGDEGEIQEDQQEQPYEESGQPPEQFEEREDDRGKEDERRNEENKERCKQDCSRPCVEKCIRESCGQEMECNVDEESKKCEDSCQADDSCVEKCMKGEGEWWKEFENKDDNKEEKGGFEAGGSCRTAKGRTEGFIWFGGWGDPFEQIQPLKNKYYSGGNADWCKVELQNLIKQREEFEKGFNQEFAKWFFEEHLANSAENWEQVVSGVFELYWSNVDNQREIAFRMKCLEKNDIKDVMNYNLINIKYETEYGKIEYWEEVKEVKIPGMEDSVTIISPYMKVWVFPPKEFIKYEMKKAMKEHEFPGPPEDKMERKNEEGPTAEEKEMIKQDKKFMKMIREIADKYGGSLDAVIQFKDTNNEEVLFNLYVQINENEIIKMKPMLPEEVPAEDVKVEIDFEKIYEMIYMQEKEMRGEMMESPPWDRKFQPIQKIKEVVSGVKMYFKVRDIVGSAKITPAESEDDMKKLFKEFFSMMMKGEGRKGPPSEEEIKEMKEKGISEEEGKEIWESKEKITGEIIIK